MSGFFLSYRGEYDSPVFPPEPYCRRHAWTWLKEHALFAAKKIRIAGRIVELQRGQLSYSLRYLAEAWGWGHERCRRFLGELRAHGMIETASETGQMVITICNNTEFQADESSLGQQARQQRDSSETNKNQGNKEKEEEDSPGGESSARACEAPPVSPSSRDVIPFPTAAAGTPTKGRKNGSAPRATLIAPDWQPDEQDREYACRLGHDDDWIDGEAEGFRDRCLRDSPRYSDWHAAWRTWVRNAERFAARDHRSNGFAGRFAEKPGEITAAMHAVLNRRHMV